MTELYSEKELSALNAQIKKRWMVIGGILAVVMAVVVWSLIIRKEWLTFASVFVFCALAVFMIELFCLPLLHYRKLILSALSGRTHTETLEFSRPEEQISRVEGVNCRELLFLGQPDKHGIREQRFYWDAELPLPAFRAGDMVTLKYTGRNIIGYQL